MAQGECGESREKSRDLIKLVMLDRVVQDGPIGVMGTAKVAGHAIEPGQRPERAGCVSRITDPVPLGEGVPVQRNGATPITPLSRYPRKVVRGLGGIPETAGGDRQRPRLGQ